MSFDFSGKSVLVTGATRGIGLGLTRALVKYGGTVYALGSNKELLDALIEEYGDRVISVHVNLVDWGATRAALEQLPPMNGLVNNAGVSYAWVPSLDAPKDIIDKTLSVNLMAQINVTQVIGKKMVEAGNGGSIVNVSSINGIKLCESAWPTIYRRLRLI
ncbi:hypothetical protein DPMN_007074 [Dreissena polymorpha]|uniref:L-xylulose reductase n=1 Tax=Dreissena polymorpha TaxID=45954 RepID=A0A9D4RVZ2_DREPO|nr:hypothetical protein DPMN_007074 [Dreissena polymorpha]